MAHGMFYHLWAVARSDGIADFLLRREILSSIRYHWPVSLLFMDSTQWLTRR